MRRRGDELVDGVAADVNHIWKHRRKADDRWNGRVMHRDHNHGPYVFVDALEPPSRVPVVTAGLAVPSLVDAVSSIAEAVRFTNARLDAAGLAKIVTEYGSTIPSSGG